MSYVGGNKRERDGDDYIPKYITLPMSFFARDQFSFLCQELLFTSQLAAEKLRSIDPLTTDSYRVTYRQRLIGIMKYIYDRTHANNWVVYDCISLLTAYKDQPTIDRMRNLLNVHNVRVAPESYGLDDPDSRDVRHKAQSA